MYTSQLHFKNWLEAGGGQDEGNAAAARASCLPRATEILFVLPSDHGAFVTREAPSQLGGPVPSGYSLVCEWHCAACKVFYHLTGTATVYLSEV